MIMLTTLFRRCDTALRWDAYALSDFAVILRLQYGQSNAICCHGHVLITKPEGSTCIYNSKNSEPDIQWCSLKYEHALKSHPM